MDNVDNYKNDEVNKMLEHCGEVVDRLVHNCYKRWITNQMENKDMIKKIYIIKDKKVGFRDETIIASNSEGLAIRGFTNMVANKNSDLWKFAEDFELCEIGAIDTEIGQLIPASIVMTIKEATDIKKEIEYHESNEKR